MGIKMTKKKFAALCNKCVKVVRKRCPKKTRNLMKHGIQFEWLGDFKFRIFVNEKEAPYMKYTNESWDKFRPPLQGKKNPNEEWWQDAYKLVVELIIKELKGEIKND